MRICPKCSAYYADDSMGFCLVEGTPLVNVDRGSDKWSEGSRAIEEKAKKLTKQKRKLRWRWIVLGGMTTLVLTMVMAKSLRIETIPPYKISGRVTDAGEAVAGVQILLGGGKTAATATDTHGNYTFGNLPAGVSYTITPVITDTKFTPPSRSINSLTKDESADFVRVIRVYTISGQVTDDAKAVSGVDIKLSGGTTESATTDANGNYAFRDLSAGVSYTVTPQPRANMKFTKPPQLINLTQDQTVDFSVQYFYTISGQVTDAGRAVDRVVIKLSGGMTATKTTDGNGNYTFSGLRAGRPYTITPQSNLETNFNPPNYPINSLTKDVSSVNFGRVQSDPKCSRDDEIREKGIIKSNSSELFRTSIENNLAELMGSAAGTQAKPLLELTGVDPTFSRMCTRADVRVSYDWWIQANGRTGPKQVGTKTFICTKTGRAWHCKLV